MSNAPSDLLAFRSRMESITGLGASALGIVGDGAHQRTGGYHEGMDVLVSIGRYHPPATSHVGSTVEDYSARQLRDRVGLTNDASGTDIGNAWPHGGTAAWLRFNNALAAALPTDQRLSAIRAINYSPNGETKLRLDREHGFKTEASTDTVTTHTHVEFYRDTEGHREETLNRLCELAQEAITGGAVTDPTTQFTQKCMGSSTRDNTRDNILGDQGSYRDWGYGVEGEVGADGTNPPRLLSRFGVIYAAAKTILGWAKTGVPVTVVLTDDQIDVLAEKIAAKIPTPTFPNYAPVPPAE